VNIPNPSFNPPKPTGPQGYGGLVTLRKGSTGLQVAYLQNLLNARMPAPALWVDGMFGQDTDARVRQYQGRRGLVVDGVVGPQTWGALEAGPPPISRRPVGQPVVVPATGGF
jgi:peptidoglycan hydrolase-like protein with peptidoglycan-binding domain